MDTQHLESSPRQEGFHPSLVPLTNGELTDVVGKLVRRQHMSDRMEVMPALGQLVASDASTTQHLKIAEDLDAAEMGLTDLKKHSTTAKESLADLETRVAKLRAGLRLEQDAADDALNVQTESQFDTSRILPSAKEKANLEATRYNIEAELNNLLAASLPIKICPNCTCEILDTYWDEHAALCKASENAPQVAVPQRGLVDYTAMRQFTKVADGSAAATDTQSTLTLRPSRQGSGKFHTDVDTAVSADTDSSSDSDYDDTSAFSVLKLSSGVMKKFGPADEFIGCDVCNRKFHAKQLATHRRQCQRKQAAREFAVRAAGDVTNPMKPDNPQGLRQCGISSTAIRLAWDAPLFDGGSAITAYEVSYSGHYPAGADDADYSGMPRHVITVASKSHAVVIAPTSIIIEDLVPNSTYVNFRVRAINRSGPSDWSDKLARLDTLIAEPPSAPIRVRVLEISQTGVELAWEPGPSKPSQIPVIGYIIRMKQAALSSGEDSLVVQTKVNKLVNRFVIEGLVPGTRYSDIHMIAIGKDGSESQPSGPALKLETDKDTQLEFLTQRLHELVAHEKAYQARDEPNTEQMEYESLLRRREIHDLQATLVGIRNEKKRKRLTTIACEEDGLSPDTALIDSVEQVGALETAMTPSRAGGRNHRADSVPMDRLDIPGAVASPPNSPPEQQALVPQNHSFRAVSVLPLAANMRNDATAIMNKQHLRQKHFENRHRILSGQLEALGNDEKLLELQLRKLHKLMSDIDDRLRLITAEYEIVRYFKGDQLESTATHGRKQLYQADDLRKLLEDEMQELEKSMATLRTIYLDTSTQLQQIRAKMEELRVRIAERAAAFTAFKNEQGRAQRLRDILQNLGGDTVQQAFQALKDYRDYSKRVKKRFVFCLSRWINRKKSMAWNKWLSVVKDGQHAVVHQKQVARRHDVVGLGLGSMLLGEAEHLRDTLRREANQTLADLMTVKQSLLASEYSIEERALMGMLAGAGEPAPAFAGPALASAAALPSELREAFNPENHPTLRITAANVHDDVTSLTMPKSLTPASPPSKDELSPTAQELQGWLSLSIAYVEQQRFVEAYTLLKKCELVFGLIKNVHGLLAVYRTLSRMVEAVNRPGLAVIMWDRTKEMATEVGNSALIAEAAQGLGRAYLMRHDPAAALQQFELALSLSEQRGDRRTAATICEQMAVAHRSLHQEDDVVKYDERAAKYRVSLAEMLAVGYGKLRELRNRVLSASVKESRKLMLEPCGILLPRLRAQHKEIQNELNELLSTKDKGSSDVFQLERDLNICMKAMQSASAMAADDIIESGICNHGVPQRYTASRFIEEVTLHMAKLQLKLDEVSENNDKSGLREKNLRVALEDAQQHIETETSALTRTVHRNEKLRIVALNGRNLRVDDAIGIAAGGVQRVIASTHENVMAYSTVDGTCVRALTGFHSGTSGTRNSSTVGHTSIVTAVAFYGYKAITGSADGSICVWELLTAGRYDGRMDGDSVLEWDSHNGGFQKDDPVGKVAKIAKNAGILHTLLGHRSPIITLAVNAQVIVSASSDNTTLLWNSISGQMIRRLRVHELATHCISLHESYFATGSVDRTVSLWKLAHGEENDSISASLCHRFDGHKATVTAVYCNGADVVSGDANGEVIVWNTLDGTALRRMQIHESGKGVLLLQFDATKVMTYGADDRMVLTDLLQGTMMQDHMMPHGGARILALQFTTHELLTVAEDRSVRVWAWSNGRFAAKPREVAERPAEHIVEDCEKLKDIALAYKVTVEDLLDWNSLDQGRELCRGTRLALYKPVGKAVGISVRSNRRSSAVKVMDATKLVDTQLEAPHRYHIATVAIDEVRGTKPPVRRDLRQMATSRHGGAHGTETHDAGHRFDLALMAVSAGGRGKFGLTSHAQSSPGGSVGQQGGLLGSRHRHSTVAMRDRFRNMRSTTADEEDGMGDEYV